MKFTFVGYSHWYELGVLRCIRRSNVAVRQEIWHPSLNGRQLEHLYTPVLFGSPPQSPIHPEMSLPQNSGYNFATITILHLPRFKIEKRTSFVKSFIRNFSKNHVSFFKKSKMWLIKIGLIVISSCVFVAS